jgi:hypothetical protein
MNDFRVLLESKTGFIPRTQAQALRAVEEGILNPEFYVYRVVNVHPIIEEPWDLNEIDRLLAKPDLDLDTTAILMIVFERMILHKDKELALFAAESINALERRYLARIQSLKKKLDEKSSRKTLRAIIYEYRVMGRLFASRPVLGDFYLQEARRFQERYADRLLDPEEDIAVYIDTLLEIGDHALAEKVLNDALGKFPGHGQLQFLAARLAFFQRRTTDVVKHLERIDTSKNMAKYAEVQLFWIKGTCRE